MRIITFSYKNVTPEGIIPGEAGSVCVTGRTLLSHPEGGCGAPGCNCSPGHWINVVNPRTPDGVVAGFTIYFDSRKSLENYLKKN